MTKYVLSSKNESEMFGKYSYYEREGNGVDRTTPSLEHAKVFTEEEINSGIRVWSKWNVVKLSTAKRRK